MDKKSKETLLALHDEYRKGLAPILHLAFAQLRIYYDKLYEATDVVPELIPVTDHIEFPLDQLLTNIKLLEKIFDDLIRPMAPERFAKGHADSNPLDDTHSVFSRLLDSTDRLFHTYAKLELEDTGNPQDFKKAIGEINLLCVLFLQYLKESYPDDI